MPIGRQSYPALNQTTVGYRVLNPQPMDVYLGPWESIGTGNTAGTTSGGVSLANSIISGGVRYQGLQVIIIANSNPGQVGGETLAYKYWYRGGTADSNLVEFSSGEGGGIVGDYVTTFNGLTGAVQGVSAAIAGNGITLSAATGSITITNIGVLSFNGKTGAVIGASLGANTFTALNTFNEGISASGATLGTLVVVSGISAAGGITLNSDTTIGGTLSVSGNFYVAGTLTTVNETQLLIQDKYLVLGSTFSTSAQADGAGVYVGSTTNAFAGICYNDGNSYWSSSHAFNIPSGTFYKIGGTNVLASTYLASTVTGSSLASVGTLTNGIWNASIIGLTWGGTNKDLSGVGVSGGIVFKDGTGLSVLSSAGNAGEYLRSGGANSVPTWASFSALTGLTADSVSITNTETTNGTYFMTFVDGTSGIRTMMADSGITYNPSTNTISCTQIEAIVDGGTW